MRGEGDPTAPLAEPPVDVRPLDLARLRDDFAAVPPPAQDAWLDALLGLDALPDDDDDLPRGGVPYLPCPAAVVARAVARARVGPDDVVVDVGSGVGRVLALVHLLCGAEGIGLEVQRHLVDAAHALAARHGLQRVRTLHGDAETTLPHMVTGTVFFFYCPFSGAKLERVVDALEPLAAVRPLRLCVVDMPLPRRAWIVPDVAGDDGPTALLTATTTRHLEAGAAMPAYAIDLGTSTRDALLASLAEHGVRTNAYFQTLLPHIDVATTSRSLTVVVTSAAALGLPQGGTLDEVRARAATVGLGPCPLEAALRLRLAVVDAPGDARLTVVSDRVVDDETFPRGLYLRHDDEGRWLRAFVASDDWVFAADERFALARIG